MLSFEDFSFKEYDSCTLCPKNCKVNRNKGEKAFAAKQESCALHGQASTLEKSLQSREPEARAQSLLRAATFAVPFAKTIRYPKKAWEGL